MSSNKRILSQTTLKAERNAKIYQEYKAGTRMEELAVKYHLNYSRIYNILKQQKKLGGENN